MTEKNKTQIKELIKSIKSQKILVDTAPYSPALESTIQEAVAYKRNGDYDKSIEIYLDIFKRTGCVNSNISAFLYKSIICAEEFSLGYELLLIVEIILIAKEGPRMPIIPFPGGPVLGYIKWAHTEYMEELEDASRNALRYRDTNYLLRYVQPKSGNPSYRFKKSATQIFEDIGKIFG